ncbi:MAG: DNA-formamidopyrimidine glycosylase family protein [Verrucomicrobiota bacterium]
MPEHPDVAAFRRRLAQTSLHRTINQFECDDTTILESVSRRRLRETLEGRAFEETSQHGKYAFARLSGEAGWLVFHFGMTGRFVFHGMNEADGDLPRYAHAVFFFDDGSRLAFVCPRKLARLALVREPEDWTEEKALGPDALAVGVRDFDRRLEGRRGGLKAALMDQSLVAGVGNVYSDEICFQERWHPRHAVSALDGEARKSLRRTMQRILKVAARHEAHPDELPRGYLLPHRHEGGHCPRCDTPLEQARVVRTSYFCPQCQS